MAGRHLSLLLIACCLGCDGSTPPPNPHRGPSAEAGSRFDARQAGAIAGRVRWASRPPAVPPFRSITHPLNEVPTPPVLDWPNPNAPLPVHSRDPDDHPVHGAVVSLSGLDPHDGRPWDLPAARVELQPGRLVVVQGRSEGRVGFVRAGDNVDLVSRQSLLHVVQGRGADFFARALPRPDEPVARRMEKPGLVELRSGSGQFWLRAYLLVSSHPYHAVTDEDGKFLLAEVPPGRYELVVWHPDWRVVRTDRHGEFYHPVQVHFRPPLEARQEVVVPARERESVTLTLSY